MGCRAGLLVILCLVACGRVDDGASGPVDGGPHENGGEAGAGPAAVGGDSGTGDTGGTGTGAAGSGGAGSGTTDERLIADCEAPNQDEPPVHDGRFQDPDLGLDTVWASFSDAQDAVKMGLTPGTVTPAEGGPFDCVEQERGGGSSWVFNANGSAPVWGAGMILLLNPSAPDGVDLSGYSALRFWAKLGLSSNQTLRVAVATEQTNSVDFDGECTGEAGACGNHFGYTAAAELGAWRQYTVWFREMKQDAWPSAMFPALDLERATGILFQVSSGSFDYSIDDVELVP